LFAAIAAALSLNLAGFTATSSYAASFSTAAVADTDLRPAARPLEEHRDSGWEESVREAHLRAYAYDPLFNGLKSRQEPRRAAMLGQLGVRFVDDRSIDDAFLFLLRDFSPLELPERPTAAERRKRCSDGLAAGRDWTESQVRLLALCLAARQIDPAQAEAGTSRAAAVLTKLEGPDGHSPDAANDALLLYRTAAKCGCGARGDRFLERAARAYSRAAHRRAQCAAAPCPGELNYRLVQFDQVAGNLLLAYLERPSDPIWTAPAVRAALTAGAEERARGLARFDARDADEAMTAACSELKLAYRECRSIYFAGPLLLPKLVFIVADFAREEGRSASACRTLSGRIDRIGAELTARRSVLSDVVKFNSTKCHSV
jgi:hypothetical protein